MGLMRSPSGFRLANAGGSGDWLCSAEGRALAEKGRRAFVARAPPAIEAVRNRSRRVILIWSPGPPEDADARMASRSQAGGLIVRRSAPIDAAIRACDVGN